MNFGCHAVLFRERIKTETDAVLSGLASSGFRGIELGSRFFGTEDKGRLVDSLKRHGLTLSGLHVGAKLDEWTSTFEEARARVLSVAEFVSDMPFKNVVMSGGNPEAPIDAQQTANRMNEVARACADLGVRLNYHNHWWEFERGYFETFYQEAPALHFAVDLGWAYTAGQELLDFLAHHPERIRYVHLRDVSSDRKTFPDLGTGVIDFAGLIKALGPMLGDDGWAVVEYEEGEQRFDRYRRAFEYLSPHM